MSLRESFTQSVSSLSGSPVLFKTLDFSSPGSNILLSTLDELVSSASPSSHSTVSEAASAPAPSSGEQNSTSSTAAAPDFKSGQRRLDFSRTILIDVIKPAFKRDGRKEVTAAGRKAMEQSYLPPVPYDSDEIRASKPWKYGEGGDGGGSWVVDVFEWCLDGLDEASLEPNWPLVIPPILSAIDDMDTVWRVRGCRLLNKLLRLTPVILLQRTGIGEVFEQALLPCLQHLPPLTGESETVELLSAVYPTLLGLLHARFSGHENDNVKRDGRVKVLDRITRQEILRSLKSVADNVAISTLLLQQLAIFVSELQVESVKHLKLMIDLLEERLTSPFATASSAYLEAALETLMTIQLNAWPRIGLYHLRIITLLSTLWCRLNDEGLIHNEGFQVAMSGIKDNVNLLRVIVGRSDEWSSECHGILVCDDRLAAILDIWNSR